jgi:stage II sporulation protein D
MKKIIAAALVLAAVLFLIPLGLRQGKQEETTQPETPLSLQVSGHTVTVLVEDQVEEMDLNEYLWGVVAAEMPASFSEEALKAQAVAARTYALNKVGKSTNHPQADLCTDFNCCQAWISRESAQNNWGSQAAYYSNKITTAVGDTNDQVILYDGALIDAVFHSSSGDTTQAAVEVWGNSVPYLQSVTSPEGDEVPDYHSQVTMTAQECKDTILASYPEAQLEGEPENWFGTIVFTAGGSVHTIEIGGVTLTGVQARSLFSLRSASFTVSATEDSVTFDVVGFGHGVGMSQYGANAMAQAGSTYTEILEHYYTGVTVETCPDDLLQD